jgi:hypothetical protein
MPPIIPMVRIEPGLPERDHLGKGSAMTTPEVGQQPWQELLEEVREVHPEVVGGSMFGMPCAKVAGKAFMGAYGGGVVFKLDPAARERALALAGSEPFDPMGGRPMREWVVVPDAHRQDWPELAEAAFTKVRS